MSEIKVKYEGIDICYNEFQNEWKCKCDLGEKEAGSLREIKEWITNRKVYLKKKNFKEFGVICVFGRRSDLKLGKVTSISDNGFVNVTFSSKDRKLNVEKKDYVECTEENFELFKKLNEKKKLREEMLKKFDKEIDDIVNKIMGKE